MYCMKKQDQTTFDIVVIGGGPAGLAFAKAVSGQGLSIAVVDPTPDAVLADPSYDGREIALTHFSKKTMSALGFFDHITADQVSLIKKAHVVNGDSPYALKFDHREAGEETLGYMVSNQNIRRSSYAAVQEAQDIHVLDQRRVDDLTVDGCGARVMLDDGRVLSARLVVGADGRFSNSRRKVGISCDMLEWGRTCLVGVMEHDGAHNDTAYECFHYDRTLAVLPLNNGLVSVVITLPSEEAQSVLDMDPAAFAADIQERFEGRVGTMRLTQKLHAYPLVCNYAKRFYAPRFALLGDAAVGMHPVTAHGYNLGLRGAHILAQEVLQMVRTGGDIGAMLPLRNYHRAHNLICKPVYMGTNTVVKLYTDQRKTAKIARKTLLHLGNVLKPARDLITRQLTESHVA